MEEDIREILAEHENRISFLENSLPGSAMSYKPEDEPQKETKQEPWSKRQWNVVQQLRGEMANLKSKFLELEKQIPKRIKKYKTYREG